MQTFTVRIEECPKYCIKVMCDTEERAKRAAVTLFLNHGESYFKQNGAELKEEK